MPQSPHRPYVPHRTPTRAQPAISTSDFIVSKPFVPGAELARNALIASSVAPFSEPAESTIPSIESFLVTARPSVAQPVDAFEQENDEELDEVPPLEHFLDPLPPISDFSEPANHSTDFPDTSVGREASASREPDWASTDWQRYDWQSVAALGDTERAQAEASNAWATTDWEARAPKHDRTKTPADAIAKALDQIAEQLRNGDLGLPGAGVSDPATIAATLAALLGVKR